MQNGQIPKYSLPQQPHMQQQPQQHKQVTSQQQQQQLLHQQQQQHLQSHQQQSQQIQMQPQSSGINQRNGKGNMNPYVPNNNKNGNMNHISLAGANDDQFNSNRTTHRTSHRGGLQVTNDLTN